MRPRIWRVPLPLDLGGAWSQGVRLREDGVLEMRVRHGLDQDGRAAVLDTWYRAQLKVRIPELFRIWEPIMGVSVADWGVRRMRSRWGKLQYSGSADLAQPRARARRPEYLEYVVVHEMVHLLERRHNRRFYAFMDMFLPNWRAIRAALNSTPPD